MPNRIIKESICTSENIDGLTEFQEIFFYRLMVNCDDYGRFDARQKILAARLFPLKDIRADKIDNALRALVSADLITLYTVDGKPYVQMNKWEKHQQIRNHKSKYPAMEDADIGGNVISIDINCPQMKSDASKCTRNPIQSESNPNPNPKEETDRRSASSRPTLDEVREYCKERGNAVDPEKWFNYYESNGWRVGKNPMRDWRACVRTWEKNGYDTGRGSQAKTNPALQYQTSNIPDDAFGDDFFVKLN